ncbi:DUF7555 family protein [Halarchaeum sp. P4]|uniref:DUF7555 family protein n=1 Tax=Halarchaeum sp. P4 TaxID=3421639 RepID=UPI003EB7836D
MEGRVWVGRTVHTATYVVVAVSLVWCVSLLVGVAFGGPLVAAKYGLFVCGWLAVGYGSWILRPRARWKSAEEANEQSIAKRARTRFQRAVFSLPPANRVTLEGTERVPSGVLVFVSGVAMLATSYLLEAVGGVGG